MTGVGLVVIGRNEGERLVRCLASIPAGIPVVYVDSGSTDDSVAAAAAAGAQVVSLDLSVPFTAARARNAGRRRLDPEIRFIQFVDGDCRLQPGWLARAEAALVADGGLAAVFGRRREVSPEASVYNWLCDVEWAVPPGPVRQFGGDVLLRAAALDQAGGYPDEMIAGEEPDLSMRLGALGWRIACLPAEMTLHDAAMTRFGQWWRRAERSGHAYAELAARHGGDYARRVRGSLFWGMAVPVAGLLLLAAAAIVGSGWLALAGAATIALPVVQILRLTLRERRVRAPRDAARWSFFLVLDKVPHAQGVARYWWRRLRRQNATLIEYKAPAA